jgi:hypothetical protein
MDIGGDIHMAKRMESIGKLIGEDMLVRGISIRALLLKYLAGRFEEHHTWSLASRLAR